MVKRFKRAVNLKNNRVIKSITREGTVKLLIIVTLLNIFGLTPLRSEIVSSGKTYVYLAQDTALSLVDSLLVVDSTALELTALDSLSSDSTLVDSMLLDSTALTYNLQDSTLIDSTKLSKDSLNIFDKSEVIAGVMPLIEEKLLESNYVSKSDTVKTKKVEVRRPYSQLALERSPLFEKDTISVKSLTIYSLVAPGFGQLYNHQYIKIPILYGVLGGFASYGVIASNNYTKAKSKYNSAVANELSTTEIASYRKEMDRYNTQKTVMFAGAACTYIYSVADGILNYKGEIHPTRKATILSAIFPGAGQLYNKKFWKLPIVYGGLATFGYVIDFNNRGYQRFKTAYNLLTDGDDSTVDEFGGYYSESTIQNTRNSYRRYRDLGIIMMAGFYLLQIVDAHVDAYLARYDISNDLAMSIEPTIIDNNQPFKSAQSSSNKGFGMGLRFDF